MEVLLKRSIESLGGIGDVVTVRTGYARNYLLPLGYAVPMSQANVAEIERMRARALAEEQERLGGLRDLLEKLTQTSVTIEGRANEEGHLFGSVTPAQVGQALREKDFELSPTLAATRTLTIPSGPARSHSPLVLLECACADSSDSPASCRPLAKPSWVGAGFWFIIDPTASHGTRHVTLWYSEMSSPSTQTWKIPLATPASFSLRRTSTVYHLPVCM